VMVFCGSALLLGVHLGPPISTFAKIIGTVLALWLCSVTSGTLYATLAALMVITLFAIVTTPRFLNKIEASIPVVFAVLLFNYDLLGALSKNIAYWGGGSSGALGMLQHGFGTIFLKLGTSSVNLVLLTAVLLGGLCLFTLLIRRLPAELRCLTLLVCTAIAIGAFGYSTLALALILVCILFGSVLQKIASNRQNA